MSDTSNQTFTILSPSSNPLPQTSRLHVPSTGNDIQIIIHDATPAQQPRSPRVHFLDSEPVPQTRFTPSLNTRHRPHRKEWISVRHGPQKRIIDTPATDDDWIPTRHDSPESDGYSLFLLV